MTLTRIPIADRRDGTIRARRSSDVDQFGMPLMSREGHQHPPVDAKAPLIGAFILGFAFGAFFDGILLHQVLQWHHLLSLVQGDLYRDIRVQILADGLFHAAAYLLAAGGLVLLWRGARPPDRIVLGWAVLGFAAWQFADVTLVHWTMGLHRVRIDVPNPLLWDVGWLVVLGTLPLIAGFWLLRGQTRNTPQPPHIARDAEYRHHACWSALGNSPRRCSHGSYLQERHGGSRNLPSGRHGRCARDLERTERRHDDYRFAHITPQRSLHQRSTPRNQRGVARLLRSGRFGKSA